MKICYSQAITLLFPNDDNDYKAGSQLIITRIINNHLSLNPIKSIKASFSFIEPKPTDPDQP